MLVTFFSLNCLHSFRASGKIESHKKNEKKDFYKILLLLKTPDLECLIEKIDACKNNPEK